MINRPFRRLFLVFLLFSLSACSTKVIYNNLDWLTYWYLDDYVNLTDVQEAEFDSDLKQFLDWHRGSELQSYATHIMLIQDDINNGLDQTDIASYIQSLKGYWQRLLIRVEPGLVKLAYSLNEQQIETFLVAAEEKNSERVEKFEALSEQQRLEGRYDKIASRIEAFIGQLTPVQKQLLHHTNIKHQSTFLDWIEFRRAWAHSVRDAYSIRNDKAAFEQSLKQSILNANDFRSEQYLKKINHNEQLWIVTLDRLIGLLNIKQRKTLNAELGDIRTDLEALL